MDVSVVYAGDLARGGSVGERAQERVLAVTLQAGQAHHFAGGKGELDGRGAVAQAHPSGAEHVGASDPLRGGQFGPRSGGQVLSSTHQPDQLLRRGLAAVDGCHGPTRSQHGDPVGDLFDLVHAVRDEDHAAAFGGVAAHDGEQPVTGGDVQRRGGFVEDQDPGVTHQRPGHPAHLPHAQWQKFHRRVERRHLSQQLLEHRRRLLALGPVGNPPAKQAVAAQPHVLHQGLRPDHQHLLEHRHNPDVKRRPWGPQAQPPTVQFELSLIGAVHAGEDLDQRALARSVLTDDGVNLAGPHGEGAVSQCLSRPERFRQGLDRENRLPCVGALRCRRHRPDWLLHSDLHHSGIDSYFDAEVKNWFRYVDGNSALGGPGA